MHQYDIHFADLNPVKWHVQSWVRPCIIVQSDLFNAYAPTVVVVPLTGTLKKPFPSEFIVEPSKKNGLKNPSRFLGSQIVTLDKRFIGEKIGVIEDKYHPMIQEAMQIVLWWA